MFFPSFQIDISTIQFDVSQKLKKLKTEKVTGPNPIAEAAIQAAKASSALQNFQINDKRKKDKKVSSALDTYTSIPLQSLFNLNFHSIFRQLEWLVAKFGKIHLSQTGKAMIFVFSVVIWEMT